MSHVWEVSSLNPNEDSSSHVSLVFSYRPLEMLVGAETKNTHGHFLQQSICQELVWYLNSSLETDLVPSKIRRTLPLLGGWEGVVGSGWKAGKAWRAWSVRGNVCEHPLTVTLDLCGFILRG
jgi:hypothetical protein